MEQIKPETLLTLARLARSRAYAPYSVFPVGAALLTEDGKVYTGANMESASLGMTVCAERVAVWSALSAGGSRFKLLAVVADCSPPPTPCGACRQVLRELAGDIPVIMGNLQGEVRESTLGELLPEPFTGEELARRAPAADPLVQQEAWRLPVFMRPVGFVRSAYREPADIPENYRELISRVIIDADLGEGLYRLEEEKRIIIVGYLHRQKGYALKDQRRGRGGEVFGIFACRAPARPNNISLTEVELLQVQGCELTVRGLDLIDGTPVLDIKTVPPRD